MWFLGTYNGLVKTRNKTKESWAQIDVQLKRRYDLIPNLVETVKGYAKHEKELLEGIAKARSGLVSGNPGEAAAADAQVSSGLRQLWAVSENYPELKANENFIQLQNDLKGTEDQIAYARQGYNDSVLQYNNKTEMMPGNIIAGLFNFKAAEFFKVASEEEREAVQVKF
ncbi:MAG: LemA family protein [Planctomycetota bacterium]